MALPRLSSISVALLCLAAALGACARERFEMPADAVGQSWHPAPSGRHGVQIMTNPRRDVQDIWYRHRFRHGVDAKIDELHGPGSLLWSPDGKGLAINHQDYGMLHDLVVFRLRRGRMLQQAGLMEPLRELWDLLHPEPVARLSFQAKRWSPDGDSILVLAIAETQAPEPSLLRSTLWLDPDRRRAEVAEMPPDLAGAPSPFGPR